MLRYTSFLMDRGVDLSLLTCGCWLIMTRRLTLGQVRHGEVYKRRRGACFGVGRGACFGFGL